VQAYSRSFAQVYNLRWGGFGQRVAPRIQAYYESTPGGRENRRLLDLCCGTGQLAVSLLRQGYYVVGIDLSEEMLQYARQNAAHYLERGQARFLQGDATAFSLPDCFGLVVSTFDALNHLPDEGALRACFRCVQRVLVPGGTFVFDLNTRAGLRANWNGINVQDTEEAMIVNRGFYDETAGRAWVKISGFLRVEGERYERFEQVAYNTVFELASVLDALREDGWQDAHAAQIDDLSAPLADPEAEHRAFIVATR
jgi:SAM-dependent methyltransferase